MTAKTILQAVCLLCFLLVPAATLSAQAAGEEKVKIEGLISHIEGLDSASFVRNGKDYSAANAGKFLRAKWNRDDKEVKTAADFIAKVATASGTTGKAYVIRFKDGKETPCGEYLTAQLKKL